MKILALDLSITCPGWCVADDDVYISSGYREHKVKGLSVYERIEANLELIAGLVRENDIGAVWMEDIASSPNKAKKRSVAVMLTEQMGIVKFWCRYRNIPVFTFPITSIKKHITGKGNADKDEMITGVQGLGYPHVIQNDEADAVSIWLYGMSQEIIYCVNE
jgi:Holliday junction resolvasome RuvABC endonuclease subunit